MGCVIDQREQHQSADAHLSAVGRLESTARDNDPSRDVLEHPPSRRPRPTCTKFVVFKSFCNPREFQGKSGVIGHQIVEEFTQPDLWDGGSVASQEVRWYPVMAPK